MSNKHRYKKEIMLLCEKGHWTAEDIFNKLKKHYFFLGIGTVYRNLQELVDEKVLMKTSGILDKVIFEKNKEPHGHIVCEHSGMILDIPINNINFDWIDLPENFNLQNINVIFDGHFVQENGEICKWVAEFDNKDKK